MAIVVLQDFSQETFTLQMIRPRDSWASRPRTLFDWGKSYVPINGLVDGKNPQETIDFPMKYGIFL